MKRFVGIEIDNGEARIAILEAEKEGLVLRSVEHHSLNGANFLSNELAEELGLVEDRYGTSIATLLPASSGYVRTLSLPFADSKKIGAVLPMELSTLLPPSIEEMVFDYSAPVEDDGSYSISAVAVTKDTVTDTIDQFGEILQPKVIDLAPFAFQSTGVGEDDKLTIYCRSDETLIAASRQDELVAHRVLLHPGQDISISDLQRELILLERSAGMQGVEIEIFGGSAEELASGDHFGDRSVNVRTFDIGGQKISPLYWPAIFLAYRAAEQKRKGINFRQGGLAYKNEWTILRRRAIAAGVLLLVSLIMVAGGAWLNISRRADVVDSLNDSMTSVYRELFPGASVVDVSLQMQGAVSSLQEQLQILGGGNQIDGFDALQIISAATPANVKIDVRDFRYAENAVRMEGGADSFESVNTMAKTIEGADEVSTVTIEDAKTSPTGDRVDFSMKIVMKQGGRDD